MQTKDVRIPYRKADSDFYLYCLGDIHGGTIHCVEDHIREKVREIKERKNAYWVGMGDYAEFIAPKDKRWDPNLKAIADWVEPDNIAHCQTEWLYNLFKPIRKKCLGLLYGNHENKIRVDSHENVIKNLCDMLEVDNLGYSTWLRLFFERENSNECHLVKGVFTHGASGAITEGAKLMALMRFMKSFDAQIYGYAHIHDYIPKSLSRITLDENGNIKNSLSFGCTTGCWFRTYTQGIIASYGEMKVYPPTEICCSVFQINPNHNYINPNRSN